MPPPQQCHLRPASTSARVAGFMSCYTLCYCFVPFLAEHHGHKLAQSIQSLLLNLLSSFNFGSCSGFQRLVLGCNRNILWEDKSQWRAAWWRRGRRPLFPPQISFVIQCVVTMCVDREAWCIINVFLGALDYKNKRCKVAGRVGTVLQRSDTLVTALRGMFLTNWE